MWNLAMYYLCGVIVPKSEEKAVDLFESILDVINQKDGDLAIFYNFHYDGINEGEILQLKEHTELNLKIIKSNCSLWRKYFDMEVCRRYQKVRDALIKEHCLDPSFTGEMYAERLKDLMNQEFD